MKFMLCFSTMFNITPITGKHYIQGPLQVQNQLKIRIIVHGWSDFDAYSMLSSNIGAIIHLQYLVQEISKVSLRTYDVAIISNYRCA